MRTNLFRNSLLLAFTICNLLSCSENDTTDKTTTPVAEKKINYIINPAVALDKNEQQKLFDAVKLFYDTTLAPSSFNGGFLVAKGGNIIFEKYRGFVNLDSVQAINANTPLHIASVSKTFTAMAILKLQEQGKLSVNDSLTKFFPQFNYPGVTVKTLLNHRSGLPNYLHFLKDVGWPDSVLMVNKDILDLLVNKKNNLLKTIEKADTKFAYCNTNYALLALIIEKVSGKTFPQFMQQNIFDPIGMKNTFVHFAGDNKTVSKSFDWKGRLMLNNNLDGIYGDKNIYSTVQDLLKWDRILADSVFLSKKSLEMAYTPYSNEKPGIKNYGFGWRMNVYEDGKKIIFHNGWWHGNNAAFIRLVKDDVTIIAMSNKFARAVYGTKILVNLFGNYFDEKAAQEDDNVIPNNIPNSFPATTKKNAKVEQQLEQNNYNFEDMNKNLPTNENKPNKP
jgi:CubicO group peptidase (beta-lactamase class C family)